MAIQESVAVRNARLDAIEATIGLTAIMKIWTGAPPGACATADSGTMLVSITLPSDWMSNAASGSKAKLGTWAGTGAAPGTAGYFRLYDSTGAVCGMQGTVTATGGGGDLTLDNVSIASAQSVTITGFTLTDGNP